jgi:zinc D-Ala-D-Ala carboxypeptidase
MRFQSEAAQLVAIGTNSTGREVLLSPVAAGAWFRMQKAAAAQGITLLAISGFRSVARQEEIIRAKLAAGETIGSILEVNAAPGYSEHHTGRAIDIGVPDLPPLEENFALTPAFTWLTAHAYEFGFTLSYACGNPQGIAYEPWHWLYRDADDGAKG